MGELKELPLEPKELESLSDQTEPLQARAPPLLSAPTSKETAKATDALTPTLLTTTLACCKTDAVYPAAHSLSMEPVLASALTCTAESSVAKLASNQLFLQTPEATAEAIAT